MVSNEAILWLRVRISSIPRFVEAIALKIFLDVLLSVLHYHLMFLLQEYVLTFFQFHFNIILNTTECPPLDEQHIIQGVPGGMDKTWPDDGLHRPKLVAAILINKI